MCFSRRRKVVFTNLFRWVFVSVINNDTARKKSWKEFDQLNDQKHYCSSYYDCSVNKHVAKCETSLRFWEDNGWINEIDLYGWFQ